MFKYKKDFVINIKQFFRFKEIPNSKQEVKEILEKFIFDLCKQNGFRLNKFGCKEYGYDGKGNFIFPVLHNLPECRIVSIYKRYDFLIMYCDGEGELSDTLTKEEIDEINEKSKGRIILQKF